ncbi:aldehyde dehydrogenase family protein [Mycobacterium vicinigordonae]|uniref:Putative succinate-semialdehyde dehydrogenase [NADP(+)] 2 n=1 Tax=Mycobacterium vicinigordonae TaxID=1719132 RepID=A0A7D6EE32_9MYCO|nr:aldehyde dehydrogenase family protein [Mycobacterium vicinigordonae]
MPSADFVNNSPDANPRPIDVRCPATGKLIGSVSVAEHETVLAVARQLRAAQPAWEAIGPTARGRHLLRFLDWMLDNEHRLIALAQSESGKSWADASMELVVAMEVIDYHAKHASEFLAERRVRPHGLTAATKKLRVRARPHQLVGVVTPWNGPIATQVMDAVGALAAGAAVLSKPSELTPLTWTECTRAWREEVGGPPILACVNGGADTGTAVVDVVDMVMFTGSTRTGRRVATRAAERLIPCSLELGGKDAMVVLGDADIDRATGAAVWGAMMNSGQVCISIERVYVEDSVYDQFVTKLVEKVSSLRQGMDAPGAFATDLGAMASAAQLQIVEQHVQDAVARGARVLVGGKRPDRTGLFFEPTILADVNHSMMCMREETFGPTLPVMRVTSETEAIRLVNDSQYGLSASVWSKDVQRAERVAAQIEAGTIDINNVLMSAFQLSVPMGGWKSSGLGSRFGGADSVLKYCRRQTVVSDRLRLPAEPHWYPARPRVGRMQARVMRLVHATDWRRRLGLKRVR